LDQTARLSQGLSGRRFLFLQGPSSRFFLHLARACRDRGASVARLCLCPGDRIYWSRRVGPGLHYRGDLAGFPAFLKGTLQQTRATDVVMLGDGRPYHAAALAVLSEPGMARPWIVEHGYIRPGLVVVEHQGIGGASAAPAAFSVLKDGDIEASAPLLPADPAPPSFLRYAALDVGFHMANLGLGWLTHPGYVHHALDHPIREYAGWAWRFLRYPARRRRTRHGLARVFGHPGAVFLLPLQLPTDHQVRLHGTGAPLQETVVTVVESFGRNAPAGALLAVKEHPLDNGLVDWRGLVHAAARRTGVADRVVLLAGGDIEALVARSAGVVTVNSTVGLTALMAGTPCKVLGRAVYDLQGLTDPQPLDTFWSAPIAPEAMLMARYAAFLRERFHIVGGFDGRAAVIGAGNLADRMASCPVAG
jgi:capsular polysaccharide export protein